MVRRADPARPLFGIVARRILLFAALAMGAQLAFVLVEYGRDPANLARLMLERETEALAGGIARSDGGGVGYALPAALMHRYGHDGSGYVARIRMRAGTVLYSRCDQSCTEHFLPIELNPPSFWLRMRADGFPLSFAGGRTFGVGPDAVLIEIAVRGDPGGEVWDVLGEEVMDHMLAPMGLTLVFVLGATLVSIRTALAPVAAAGEEAERLDPMRAGAALDTTGMPREIAQFARAVNRSYTRLGEVVQSQRLFTSAIAHEIRTPLAIIALELERIDHPRARAALAEIAGLTRFVEQMVALARLEAIDSSALTPIDLDQMLEGVVTSVAGWVYEHGASVAFEPGGGGTIHGHEALLHDAVRNLVENAVRHGGPGVAITVASAPGRITVIDDGAGIAESAGIADGSGAGENGRGPESAGARRTSGWYRPAGGVGIGLEIVRRIAALHGARFDLHPANPHGTAAVIRFGDAAAPASM